MLLNKRDRDLRKLDQKRIPNMKMLRVKQPDCEVTLIDIDKIVGWVIELMDEGYYEMMVMTSVQVACCLCRGTFDECHSMLNKIIGKLKYDVVDV